MKICPTCGNNCNDKDEFCFICGTKFEVPMESYTKKQMKFCMNCGKNLIPGAAFCMECGTPVGSVGKSKSVVKYQHSQVLMGGEVVSLSGNDVTVVDRGTQIRTVVKQPNKEIPAVTSTSGNSSIYIVEFLSALFRAHNIPVIIYMFMNVAFIAAFCFLMFPDVKIAIPIGLAVYFISLAIALSPIGESLLRFQTHCSPLSEHAVIQRIMPIFNEAKRRAQITAMSEGRSIPEDIELFYNDDPGVNAFATGRKTICFTKGILSASDEMLLAAFEHEFGHIAHHDTDSILLITVGNLIFSAIITLFRIGIVLGDIVFKIVGIFAGGDEGVFMILMSSLSRFLSLIFIDLFMAVWTGIGNLLVLRSSRSQEYKADEFAFKCGKGRELQAMLTFLEGGNLARSTGLFATLKSSHPDTVDRIAALQQLEVNSIPIVR